MTLLTRSTPFWMPKKQTKNPRTQTRIVQNASDGASVRVLVNFPAISSGVRPWNSPVRCQAKYFIIHPATVV